ncbi:2210_t:CDS:2 [Diversispora eburnea]|uniref:2210_t:CDS:1 n=1 Tax=Diversispora eburnea TaxID=1213867 RepID=A0A9N8YLZ4_9GLOM|nr:2210_t:CDS:2 [Diversispora eburnea]
MSDSLRLPLLPLELILAVLSFVPSRDLCRYMSLCKAFEYEIRGILVERIQYYFEVGKNYLLATIEPPDVYSSGPTHIFDLVLFGVDASSLKSLFKINKANNDSFIEHSQGPKIIARKLEGDEGWETIRQNAYINVESYRSPIIELILNVSIHVFSPHDIRHEAIYVSKGSVNFKINVNPESIPLDIPIDDNSTISFSKAVREINFESIIVNAFVEMVTINSGVLLTAIEEMWKDDVSSLVLEESDGW